MSLIIWFKLFIHDNINNQGGPVNCIINLHLKDEENMKMEEMNLLKMNSERKILGQTMTISKTIELNNFRSLQNVLSNDETAFSKYNL